MIYHFPLNQRLALVWCVNILLTLCVVNLSSLHPIIAHLRICGFRTGWRLSDRKFPSNRTQHCGLTKEYSVIAKTAHIRLTTIVSFSSGCILVSASRPGEEFYSHNRAPSANGFTSNALSDEEKLDLTCAADSSHIQRSLLPKLSYRAVWSASSRSDTPDISPPSHDMLREYRVPEP